MQQQRYLGFLIALAHRRLRQAVSARVSDLELSAPQFWTLIRILEHEGCSLGELAQRARIDEPTASRVVFALVRRGLVRSETDPSDRRRTRLSMTAEGRKLAQRLVPVSAEIRGAVEGALTPADHEAVASGLQKVIARLEAMGAGLVEGRDAS